METLNNKLDLCERGNYSQVLQPLLAQYSATSVQADKVRLAAAIAASYIQMQQTALAEPYLRFAYEHADTAVDKAAHAIALGNWQQSRGNADAARASYDVAITLAGSDAGIAISSGLNRLKLDGGKLSATARISSLNAYWQRLPAVSKPQARIRFAINLGAQAKAIGPAGHALAYQAFDYARQLAQAGQESRLLLEALDQLAQMYEDAHRQDDALALSDQAMLVAQTMQAHDFLIAVEWRRGRILRQRGQTDMAIAAYQRALDHIEAIRTDIPVEYQDGKSSFRETLEPVYLGLADMLLQGADQLNAANKEQQLRRARNVLELIKQTELQDYLGDRCAVESARANRRSSTLAPGTAIIYPVILPSRMELLLETAGGMQHRSIAVSADSLRAEVIEFGSNIRDNLSFKPQAKRLYDMLLAPLDSLLQQKKIETLVIIPDGALRLLPFAALHDGQRFAIEKYAIAIVPALTLTNTAAREQQGTNLKTLLAGMSEPGAVVDKLPAVMVEQLLAAGPQSATATVATSATTGRQLSRGSFTRSMRSLPAGKSGADSNAAMSVTDKPAAEKLLRHQQLQQMLSLNGVDEEIRMLEKLAPGQTLLNAGFTVSAFAGKIKTGDYQIVHIASHGVFGGTADNSFLMAHDDLITMNGLQQLLRAGEKNSRGLELLTLSACETAEGDDRAPLGLSGAALKAHAKSALGSLWPVSDDAASALMAQFYRNLSSPANSKVQALQKAQLELLKNDNYSHPFYWAPFIMVGSWL
ncbi:CHAT domain-containing protein [Undibacterium sp. CY18W]|uniref:CHAT domain-containing protein n=2 Tax=Undibacterium hunanense TaxID=2762292 RepID=A0ABR6ZSC2_9BURK|nr:CHAT domain-containing protein [Undibacterium hunanense]